MYTKQCISICAQCLCYSNAACGIKATKYAVRGVNTIIDTYLFVIDACIYMIMLVNMLMIRPNSGHS